MSDDNPHQPLEFIPPSVDHLAALLPAYKFDKLIATGGMGAVYKATQTSLDRPVAVKVLPPELGESKTFRESFVKEAKLMARLNHPNLISVFDFGEIEGMLYIVMEFVDGATLHEKIYGNPLKQQEALEITIAICRGLANAHEAGILHRDIKPANIFITQSGIPKVGDFGLARPSGDTETGIIFGTPGYTAPEVLGAPDKVGPATDIFAVGVMLYELLSGKIPGTLYEPITKYAKCDPMIDRLIRKAVSAKLEQRYSSSEDFADDLDEIFRKTKKVQSKSSSSPLLAKANRPAGLATGSQANSNSAKRGQASPPHKVVTSGGGSNLRNFIIILVLLGAIYGVLQWKDAREVAIAKIEKQNEDIEKLNSNQENSTAANSAASQPSKFDSLLIASPKNHNSRKTLEQLRTRLVAGERPINEMPKATIPLENGTRYALFVDKNLTWYEATLFASRHGAQLATVGSSSDLSALSKAIPAGENAWIGAATAGSNQWAWTDGTAWNDSIDIRKTSKLSFAQIDSDMFATAKKSKDTAKFLIEWKSNKSQPAGIRQQMKRVAATLASPKPLYPAGSISFANRNYYLSPHPLRLSQAQKLAELAGAHIATPSDEVEMIYFSDFVSANVPTGMVCRIGGVLVGSEWKWLSGEDWTGANWEENSPKGQDSIVIASSSTGQWRDLPKGRTVAYTLFEWSNDAPAKANGKLAQNNSPLDSEFSKLQSKAATLVKDAHDAHEKQLAENLTRLKWDLDVHLKGLAKNERTRQAYSIQEIKKHLMRAARIEQAVLDMADSSNIQKILIAASDKQARIESSYREDIDGLRIIYQKKLRSIIQDLEGKSQLTAAKQAKFALEDSSAGIDAFIKLFN